MPRNLGHGPVEAAGARGRLNLGEFLGNFAVFSENLELGEGKVAETMMPSHEFGLVIGGDDVDAV